MEVKGYRPAAVGFIGWSGSGKTTLLERLLPVLQGMGLRTGYLKGSRAFEMDREGKDSDRLFKAGAERVLIASGTEAALRLRYRRRDVRSLLEEYFRGCELVVVEGFRDSSLPKIEVCLGKPMLLAGDPTLLAVVSDHLDPRPVPRFGREEVTAIARFTVKAALSELACAAETRSIRRLSPSRVTRLKL